MKNNKFEEWYKKHREHNYNAVYAPFESKIAWDACKKAVLELLEQKFNRNLLSSLDMNKLSELEKEIEDKKINNNIFFNHMKAKDIKKKIGNILWKKYFIFSIERNPYDKIISFMFFANRFKKTKNIKKEIQKTINFKKYFNYPLYTENNKIIIDYLINYDDLKSNIKFVEKKIKIPILKNYMHTKNYTRKSNKDFKYFFNKSQSNKIYRDCKQEFIIMKYKKLYE